MNGIINTSSKHAYHRIANVEFTGLYDRMVYNFGNNTENNRRGSVSDYHLFIRYGDKVYIDVKGVGEIVISFAELQKNKYLKYYYNISLLLTKDKNLVVQDLKYSSNYLDNQIYEEERFWSIDTAFIETSMNTKGSKILDNEFPCYFKINPYNLEYWDCSSQEDADTFLKIYMTRTEFKNKVFEKKCVLYNKLVIDYSAGLMENELDEISAIFEEKKNVLALAALNEGNNINNDVLMLIYNNIVSTDGNKKYAHLMSEQYNYGRLERAAQILEA